LVCAAALSCAKHAAWRIAKPHQGCFHASAIDAVGRATRKFCGTKSASLEENVAKDIAGRAPGIKTQEELFRDSWGHPTAAIMALAAYCHFSVIYHRSPVGLPVPSILTQSNIPAEDLPALNLLLQQLAWDAVVHHPMSGVSGAVAPSP